MAFWGVEVKSGKPITHSCEKARGRLRISGATLGFGEASNKFCESSKKTIVQCNVGDRRPVLLCVLVSNKKESCRLDLEFEEVDDVVFSVIGPQSVYLTGYYVQRNHWSNSHSDTESYGVDIENTQADGSSYRSDDDVYEDSFINDDNEIKVSPQSPVLSSKGIDEFTLENDELKERKVRGKRLKKKYKVIGSVDEANSHECEDEDASLSVLKSKRAVKTTVSDTGEKVAQVTKEMDDEAKDDVGCHSELEQKDDDLVDTNSKLQGEKKPPYDEEKTGVNEEKNELPEEDVTLDKIIVNIQNSIHGNNTNDTSINQSLPVSDGKDQLPSLDLTKPKKKRKGRSVKEDKTSKFQTDIKDHNVLREDKQHEVEASTNMELGENCLVTHPELGSVNGQNSTKRRKKLPLEGLHTEGIDEKYQYIPKEDTSEQGLRQVDGVIKDLGTENGESRAVQWEPLQLLSRACGEYEDQQRIETSAEGIGAKCHTMPGEDEVMQEPHAKITTEDVTAANAENQEHQIDKNITAKIELLANDKHLDKKTKKKKKKTKGEVGLNVDINEMTDNQETTPMKYEDQSTKTMPFQKWTLSNGLIIEELASGPLSGKVASLGKRVKIHYTAMLKESGHVTSGNTACKFRLGDEDFIDGLNVGIEGMHVGDKRRLIIPPSLGFGDHEVDNIPPNSWLIYDIELVGVSK